MRRTHNILCLALGGAFGCSTYSTMKDLPLDCSVEDNLDVQYVDKFDTVGSANLWTAGDMSVGSSLGVTVDAISDGARCGSTAALVIRSVHNNDWGSLFGINNFASPTRDESAYDGMSFWARSPGSTTKGFTILLDDRNTGSSTVDGGSNCTSYNMDGGVGTTMTIYDSNGMPVSGVTTNAPPPGACGNGYTAVQVVTTDWRFYTLPWARFQQSAMPNRVPNSVLTEVGKSPGTSLLTNELMNLTLRMPKEADMELWIDNLGFYRKKGTAAGDGGADAR